MFEDQRLLVVDDEEAICEGCRRIFTRQGFQVEKVSDAQVGLQMAEDNNYAAILLDIKMPNMTGIEFLEHLRGKRPDVPVILMTGYPSVPNAISAIRLGAAAYVTKPFTPEEISKAVHEQLRGKAAAQSDAAVESKPENWIPAAEGFSFWHDSWAQHGEDGSVRMGTLLPPCGAGEIQAVRLPKLGETVYQGLPMAGIELKDKPPIAVAAPLSGVVVAVNDQLANHSAALWEDPCGRGWIAGVCPTRYEEEIEFCAPHRVILLNADAASAQGQQAQLTALGCHVRLAANWEDLASPLNDKRFGAVLFDAASFGKEGPALVGRINAAAPAMKIVLVASADSALEAAYRAQRIFYYAVEPFADQEITEILQAIYRTPAPVAAKRAVDHNSAVNIATINLVTRNGTKVRLMPDAGLLHRDEGLGQLIRQRLLARLLPIETSLGDWVITPTNIVKVAGLCDRVVVLMAREVDRLPGSLLRDTKAEFVAVAGQDVGNVTTLVIQPAKQEGGLAGLDDATLGVLADHIVNDLASY
jgi:DNA-binding response OmpR family regulator